MCHFCSKMKKAIHHKSLTNNSLVASVKATYAFCFSTNCKYLIILLTILSDLKQSDYISTHSSSSFLLHWTFGESDILYLPWRAHAIENSSNFHIHLQSKSIFQSINVRGANQNFVFSWNGNVSDSPYLLQVQGNPLSLYDSKVCLVWLTAKKKTWYIFFLN